MTRLFTNRSGDGFRSDPGKSAMQANFKSSLRTVARHMEGLFLEHTALVRRTIDRILASIDGCRQRRRLHRSYLRCSRKPASKWRPPKPTATAA